MLNILDAIVANKLRRDIWRPLQSDCRVRSSTGVSTTAGHGVEVQRNTSSNALLTHSLGLDSELVVPKFWLWSPFWRLQHFQQRLAHRLGLDSSNALTQRWGLDSDLLVPHLVQQSAREEMKFS